MQKILIVDDDPINIQILTLFLQDMDVTCEEAFDGQMAWEKLIEEPSKYSLIITDRIMPYIDALQLLEKLKAHDQLKNIPVIVVTGVADKEEMVDVIKAGAFDFLVKPIEKELVLSVVKRALKKGVKK